MLKSNSIINLNTSLKDMYQKADKIKVQNHLMEQFGLPAEQVIGLLTQFFDAVKEHQTSLEDAIKSDDCEVISKAAHKYKGALANLGLGDAADLALNIETVAKAGKTNFDYASPVADIREIVSPLFQ